MITIGNSEEINKELKRRYLIHDKKTSAMKFLGASREHTRDVKEA